MYIGFKTSFYVVRHLDSTASYLPTGLYLGLFRSWPSLYVLSSFSSAFLVFSFVSASTSNWNVYSVKILIYKNVYKIYSILVLKIRDGEKSQVKCHSVYDMHAVCIRTSVSLLLCDPKESRPHIACDVRHVGRCRTYTWYCSQSCIFNTKIL